MNDITMLIVSHQSIYLTTNGNCLSLQMDDVDDTSHKHSGRTKDMHNYIHANSVHCPFRSIIVVIECVAVNVIISRLNEP